MRYAAWGGLPATLTDCPSFEEDRKTSAQLQTMFDTLDQLSTDCADCTDFDRIAAAMVESKLTAQDVHHYNSPLLDGLWKLVSGEDLKETSVNGTSMDELLVDRPQTFSRMFVRLLIPRWYKEAVEFLGWWKHVTLADEWFSTDDVDLCCASSCRPLVCAAGAGNFDLVDTFLKHDVSSYVERAFVQAARNGHEKVMSLLSVHEEAMINGGLLDVFDDSPLLCNHDALLGILRVRPDLINSLYLTICEGDLVGLLDWVIGLDMLQQYPYKDELLEDGFSRASPRCLQKLSTDERFGMTDSVTLGCGTSSSANFECPAWIEAQRMVRSSPFFRKIPVVDSSGNPNPMVDSIQQAASHGQFDVLRLLVEGCDFLTPGHLAQVLSRCLLSAIQFGDVAAVSFMINHNALVECKSDSRLQLVAVAAATGNEALVSLLLASWSGDADEVAQLQQFRSQGLRSLLTFVEESVSVSGELILPAAIRHGQQDFMKWWLDGADTDGFECPDEVRIAVERADLGMAELLLSWDPKVFDRRNFPDERLDAIVSIARLGYVTLLRVFFLTDRLEEWSACVDQMLIDASGAGQLEAVQYMVEQMRLCARKLQPYVLTLLNSVWFAALKGRHAVCLFLAESLCSTADLDPALLCKMRRSVQVLRSPCHPHAALLLLVRSLLDLAEVSTDGVSQDWRLGGFKMQDEDYMQMAAASGQTALVQFFLDCGAVLRYQCSAILQVARKGGHDAVVELLVSRGALLYAVDSTTSNPSSRPAGASEAELVSMDLC